MIEPKNPATLEESPAGQPEAASAIQEVDSQPRPLDESRVQEIVKKSMTETMSEFYKQQKSQMDKQEARIKKEVQSQIESLKKIGIDVSDDMAKNIETIKRQEIVTESQSDGLSDDAGQQTPPDQSTKDPVILAAMREVETLEKSYGFELDQTDPEAGMIDHTSPFKFTKSYEKAMEAKKERLESEGNLPDNPLAQIPTSGGGSTPGNKLNNMNIDDVWEQAQKTMRR